MMMCDILVIKLICTLLWFLTCHASSNSRKCSVKELWNHNVCWVEVSTASIHWQRPPGQRWANQSHTLANGNTNIHVPHYLPTPATSAYKQIQMIPTSPTNLNESWPECKHDAVLPLDWLRPRRSGIPMLTCIHNLTTWRNLSVRPLASASQAGASGMCDFCGHHTTNVAAQNSLTSRDRDFCLIWRWGQHDRCKPHGSHEGICSTMPLLLDVSYILTPWLS